MNYGQLKEYFKGIASKVLSEVEVNPVKSNQHEFNATRDLKKFLGTEKLSATAKYLYIDSRNDLIVEHDGFTTYYDARENHEKRTEFRVYYDTNDCMKAAKAGDILFIALTTSNTFLYIIVPDGSNEAYQISWLFGITNHTREFKGKDQEELDSELNYVAGQILELIGVELTHKDDGLLELLLSTFGGSFPKTREFSLFARSLVELEPTDDPDKALLAYMQKEEKLFKILESFLVEKQLKPFFEKGEMDIEEFIKISLSIQNRRKSRAGYAMEYHLAHIFTSFDVSFSSQAFTERRKRPDYLFPNIEAYKNPKFPREDLRMLGVKTSLKERWAQVLTEAEKIEKKHLITLQAAISPYQTEEMLENNLWLVIPKEIQSTYSENQRDKLLSLSEFIEDVKSNQSKHPRSNLLF